MSSKPKMTKDKCTGITPGKEDPHADLSPEELSRMLTPAQKKQVAAGRLT